MQVGRGEKILQRLEENVALVIGEINLLGDPQKVHNSLKYLTPQTTINHCIGNT